MPAIAHPTPKAPIPSDALRVLVTGYGPFRGFTVNPSWLAVKPLHNAILLPESVAGEPTARPIHITALQMPVVYDTVLNRVPDFHARPPMLPEPDDGEEALAEPPLDGYDFVLHVGVAGAGPLRIEKIGHKTGYDIPDAEGKMAPVVEESDRPNGLNGHSSRVSAAEEAERARVGMPVNGNGLGHGPVRGFGKGYEGLPETLESVIDADKLVEHLLQLNHKVKPSTDAGHYLCDFICYCSLACSYKCYEENGEASKVLFMHCPPVDEPLSTEEVTNAVKDIILWVCKQE